MFSNSEHVVVQGSTFLNVLGCTPGIHGMDILKQNIATGAIHDSREEGETPTCYPGTRTALLENIMNWVEKNVGRTQFLWLEGPTGSGKTTIANTFAKLSSEKGRPLVGFFFSKMDGRKDDKRLIATIAYQFVRALPELRTSVEAAVIQDPLIFTKPLAIQIKHLIIQPLQWTFGAWHPPTTPKLILIDGLDECQPEASRQAILEAMYTEFVLGSLPFRIIIASKAEPDIRATFDQLRDTTTRISLHHRYNTDIDIDIYLRSRFSDILSKRPNMASLALPWPSEKDRVDIISRSSGQFIYAATVIRYTDAPGQRPDERLEFILSLPGPRSDFTGAKYPFSALDALYQQIFSQVVDISVTKRILGAILVLKTSLPVHVLESLLDIQPGDAQLALSKLSSVLHVPEFFYPENPTGNHIRLLHASLAEFLVDPNRAGAYHIDVGSAHATLTECCLKWMARGPMVLSEDTLLSGVTKPNYAWEYWTDHFLSMRGWSDSVMSTFKTTPPIAFLLWLKHAKEPENFPVNRCWALEQFRAVKLQLMIQVENGHQKASGMSAQCKTILEIYFKSAWQNLMKSAEPCDASLISSILAVVLKAKSISAPGLATLFSLEWDHFSRITRPMDAFIRFGTSEVTPCKALLEFIESVSGRPEFNIDTPEVHASLVIHCIECIARQSLGDRRGGTWNWRQTGAYHYALEIWHDHLKPASAIRLLNYAYTINVSSGHEPTCPHNNNNQCPIACQVEKITRCIESRIIDGKRFPHTHSGADMKLLTILKEIIDIKYLNTPEYSSLNAQIQEWSRNYKLSIYGITTQSEGGAGRST